MGIVADYLEGFTEEVNAANDALRETNIPEGFRRAALVFEAQDPFRGFQPVDVPFIPIRATDGAALPGVTVKRGSDPAL